MDARRPALVSLTLFASALAIAWRRYWTGERSPFQLDVEFYHHPVTHELARAWSEGRVPLWTDRIYCGFPFFADAQTAAWYPATLLVVGLGPHAGYVAFLLLHALLAAIGGLALLRSHGAGWPAAWAGGLIAPLSGFYVYETVHPGLFAILCWVPLWLVATRAAFLRPGPGPIALAALPLVAMAFAGTLQVMFGVALLFAAYVAALVAETLRERGRGAPRALRGLAAVVGAQLLALGAAAVVLLPTFAHFPLTARALGMTRELASLGSAHPLQLLGLFWNRAEAMLAPAPGTALDFEGVSFYVGALTLPLALLGLASAKRPLAIALGSGVLALGAIAAGRYGGLHPLLFEAMPGIVGSLRGMGRALGPLVVALALLAGLGLHAASDPRRRTWLFAGIALTLLAQTILLLAAEAPVDIRAYGSVGVLVAALSWLAVGSRRPALLVPGLAALIAIDLLAFGAVDDVIRRSPRPPDARQRAGALRFPVLADIAAGRFGTDAEGGPHRVALLGGFGSDNFTLLHGLDGVGGYNPLVPLQYLDYVHRVDTGRARPRTPIDGFVHDAIPSRVGAGLFQAASARFLISPQPLEGEAAGLRLIRRSWHPITRAPVLVYENERMLPRAYLSYRTHRAESPAALDREIGPDFDPRERSVFEGDALPLDGPPGADAVKRRQTRPEELHFEVSSQRSALLVVADAWYPGWSARVDGEARPVLRVNGQFRGVAVPAGTHRVEMRFEPWTFRVGAALSLASLGALGGLLGIAWFRRTPGIW